MGRYIMKADRDRDLYVEWSTIVDAPIGWGTLEEYRQSAEWGTWLTTARLAFLEEHGTTAMYTYPGQRTQTGAYDDTDILIANMGDGRFYLLPRANLHEFITAIDIDADPAEQEANKAMEQAALDRYATPNTDQ